ncbi:MAG: CIA30 family protein [Chloroflexota bacterium]|nr:CIA30 family protein [Chloroflexota bacterium]
MNETLFDFTSQDAVLGWNIVNDGVMGGVSESAVEWIAEGAGRFSGVVRLENNGGFASLRARFTPLDLSAYEGIEISLRGDGQRYGMYLSNQRSGVQYDQKFDTVDGEWMTVQLPFSDFYPVYFGQRIPFVPLNASSIRGMTFIIEEKQAGAFTLDIARIGVYRRIV